MDWLTVLASFGATFFALAVALAQFSRLIGGLTKSVEVNERNIADNKMVLSKMQGENRALLLQIKDEVHRISAFIQVQEEKNKRFERVFD